MWTHKSAAVATLALLMPAAFVCAHLASAAEPPSSKSSKKVVEDDGLVIRDGPAGATELIDQTTGRTRVYLPPGPDPLLQIRASDGNLVFLEAHTHRPIDPQERDIEAANPGDTTSVRSIHVFGGRTTHQQLARDTVRVKGNRGDQLLFDRSSGCLIGVIIDAPALGLVDGQAGWAIQSVKIGKDGQVSVVLTTPHTGCTLQWVTPEEGPTYMRCNPDAECDAGECKMHRNGEVVGEDHMTFEMSDEEVIYDCRCV